VTRPRPPALDAASLPLAAGALAERDADLARIVAERGLPPMWARPPGFATLLQIILEQQVSLASARAAYRRLSTLATPLTPARFLSLPDDALRAAGFSRQKASYARHLARALQHGALDLDALGGLDDETVRARLTSIKGIGHWTADVYLLMALLRTDVWPRGDLALAAATRAVKRLPAMPTAPELAHLSRAWAPWRSVAARLLWLEYLARRGRVSGPAADRDEVQRPFTRR
jgi:DNA-3-methyladenine glycosylase II